MKKLIALVIAAMMILSMIPVMAISTSAAVEGDWMTYRFASEYDDPDEEPDPNEEPSVYKPEPGYEYTSEGFSIIQADYKDTTPSFTVQTKEPRPIKEGIYLQFRIDEYSYDGGTLADQWICLSLTNRQKVAPGSTQYGGGWLTLIRGNGDGNAQNQPHVTVPADEEGNGGDFQNHGGTTAVTIPMDNDGREIYTFEVKWNGTEYEMYLNDTLMAGGTRATEVLEALDPNGEFYVGINIQANVMNGKAALTILKFGTSADEATKPVGDDTKQPEENEVEIAPIADPNTVEANKPAILWNPETYNLTSGTNCKFTAQGDNTWKMTASSEQFFFNFNPKRSWSYDAVDFPVFGILLRNCWADAGTIWYAAGDVVGAQNDYQSAFSLFAEADFYGDDDEYVFLPYDLTDMWDGRINTVRLDFAIQDADLREFEICFAGMFRSTEEATAYAKEWIQIANPDIDVNATEEVTEKPTEAPTDAPDDATQAPDDATQAPGDATQAPDETEADKSGCGAVVGFSAALVMAAAAAAVALKKKD